MPFQRIVLSSIPLTVYYVVFLSFVVLRGAPTAFALPENYYIWFNSGEDKVTKDELREFRAGARIRNSVWNGKTVALFGARNEVISAAMVLEAPLQDLHGISVSVSDLRSTSGGILRTRQSTRNELFNFVERNIELFYVRYLPINGLSRNAFETYDERHIPKRFRRPHWLWGRGRGTWSDRADAGKEYPDIAVPLELVGDFSVRKGTSQIIWFDFYLPRDLPAGLYSGSIRVVEHESPHCHQERSGVCERVIPLKITVLPLSLPDNVTAKTMLVINPTDINRRYLGKAEINPSEPDVGPRSVTIRQNHFKVARRHRVSLVDSNYGATSDEPSPYEWHPRLDGSLYTHKNGYQGPGEGIPHDIFVIGLYGTWSWRKGGRTSMWEHTNTWEGWFSKHAPEAERFLYLIDESNDYPQIEEWSAWMRSNPGIGRALPSFATTPLTIAIKRMPSLRIAASTLALGDQLAWSEAVRLAHADPEKRVVFYNGHRPGTGTFVIEDDGVALRQVAWTQWKVKAHRWFYWESTYYTSFQGRSKSEVVETNVFRNANTFGGIPTQDPVFGETSWNYSNGDGVLFYPGRDHVYPSESYEVEGPLASLRLKHWRRGIQDVEYLVLANKVDPERTRAIVSRMVPKVLWEYGVARSSDPTWQRTDISWSTDPDEWEKARSELGEIILSKRR